MRELQEMRPFQSKFNVTISKDPALSSWIGACELASRIGVTEDILITRQDYNEKGGDYLKEHRASNIYNPSPAPFSQSQSGTVDDVEIDLF